MHDEILSLRKSNTLLRN